jgi:hypothetical protein
MSVLERIAYYENRRDEAPNQELAHELAQMWDREGIKEIAENLRHKNKSVRSDCLKVLYEIGYINPALIADYTTDLLGLLKSKDNRMVWGAMIGLATVAPLKPHEIWVEIDNVIAAVDHGTLITLVWGVRTLAAVASADRQYSERIFPMLTDILRTCIPRDVPTHAQSMLPAIDDSNREAFLGILEERRSELTPAQLSRLRKVERQLGSR